VVPTLEITTATGKKLIGVKHDDDNSKGRGGLRSRGRSGSGSLRAVSITGGRVKTSAFEPRVQGLPVGAEHHLEEVPAEILAQVPDDLLEPRQERSSFAAPDENDSEAQNSDHGAISKSMQEFKALAKEIERDINAEGSQDEQPDAVSESEPSLPYSPFEAEPENITGVFRLKARPATQDLSKTSAEPDAERPKTTHSDINPRPAPAEGQGSWWHFFSNLNTAGGDTESGGHQNQNGLPS
jgi:hypothetical protein